MANRTTGDKMILRWLSELSEQQLMIQLDIAVENDNKRMAIILTEEIEWRERPRWNKFEEWLERMADKWL